MISLVFPDSGFYDSSAIATRVGSKIQLQPQVVQPKKEGLRKAVRSRKKEDFSYQKFLFVFDFVFRGSVSLFSSRCPELTL